LDVSSTKTTEHGTGLKQIGTICINKTKQDHNRIVKLQIVIMFIC